MTAILELHLSVSARHSQPRLVNERGGLQRLAGGFAGHPLRGQSAQFLIDQREKFFGGFGVAVLDAVENARNVAHGGTPPAGLAQTNGCGLSAAYA
jgi:hypothetical protein